MTERERDEEREPGQHPIVHEGAAPDPEDTNEEADERATILQPSGDPIPPRGDD